MKKWLLSFVVASMFAVGLVAASALANVNDKPPSPPGQGPCEHGNAQKPCKDDPQPDHGKDCDEHGKKGGVNEDHCKGNDTTTTVTTTTTSTPTTTTGTTTTGTTTTGTTTTEQTTTVGTLPPPVTLPPVTTTTTTTTAQPPVVPPAKPNTPNNKPNKPKTSKPGKPKHSKPKPPPACPPGETYYGVCGVEGNG